MHAAALTLRSRANTRVSSRLAGGLLCAALGLAAVGAAAEPLVIDYIVSNAPQRTTWVGIIDRFAAANPDIQVTHNGYPQEQYKRDFTARLRGGQVDVAFWYAGERLRDAASNKLLAPLDADMVALLRKNRFAPATIEGTRVDGEVYGFPLYYYVWGFAYRKSLFERLDLRPPVSAQADATTRATLLGPATRAIWTGAAGLTYFFDRDATAELVAPAYEGMRRFLKPPHDTDQAVRYIEQQREAARRIAPRGKKAVAAGAGPRRAVKIPGLQL
jgi:ABC-type glycerol-3-phosphate transport system substrate-binding protein